MCGCTGAPAPAAGAAEAPFGAFSKPVATTVTCISSDKFSSNAVPQMMFASGWADWVIRLDACSTSSRPMSGEEVMLIITPLAPAIEVSSSGLEMAAFAAFSALPAPLALPTPIWA